jgi:hypothetical protein
VPRNDDNHGYLFLNRRLNVITKRKTIEAIFCYRIPIDEIASCLAMTLTDVVSFLIKKRYVIAKEERLNILLLSDTQKEIASYLARTATEVDSFLIEKRYVIAKEERLNNLLLSDMQKEIASHLAMTATTVIYFLIEKR